jgi:hypothetical protein
MKRAATIQVVSRGGAVTACIAALNGNICVADDQLLGQLKNETVIVNPSVLFDSSSLGMIDDTSQTLTSGKVAPSDVLAERFFSLVNKWKNETGHFSVIARRYENPAYKAILEMKSPAIPLILNELKRNPDRWFSALEKLTGANPAKDAVNFYEAVDQWVAWGIANEYIA